MFRLSNFEKNLENATSHLRLEPDWPSILLICDEIRQNDFTPKQALVAIRKKMNSPNPHTAAYALLVLESIVKNCGSPVHDEICTKENCEMFTTFIETTPHDNVKTKMLELIQAWAFAFRTYDKYQAIKDTMTILKTKGHTFPELKEADAMFTSDTAPDWSDGKVCNRCRVPFSFTQRKHHCRNCGQIFCAQCSDKTCTLPKYGIEKEVRVCDGCFTTLLRTPGGSASAVGGAAARSESDLPAEYLASSLAQQSQSPPRKTEQELKEEEELQLALALSQSEAEQKNRLSTTPYRSLRKSPSPEVSAAVATVTAPTYINLTAPVVNPAPAAMEDPPSDPELAKYLNRDYWEQRKTLESPASPSAPSPMSQTSSILPTKSGPEDIEIDEFSANMRSQVEIFVNRMKSNSSRGRSIANDSSVQTLFITLTSFHSNFVTYIKGMDDKRMWFEQLQDKLAQVKDSRAALDVLRQEHQDKLRAIAEEQERQRQMQMAHKLEIMRKKKQEYLQYQRQLALQRIQEQEREMQMRQEQQKALYQMGGANYGYMPPGVVGQQQGSPIHHMVGAGPIGVGYGGPQYGYNPIGQQRFGQPQLEMYGAAPPPHMNMQPGMMHVQGQQRSSAGPLPANHGISGQGLPTQPQQHGMSMQNQYIIQHGPISIGPQGMMDGHPPNSGMTLPNQMIQQQQQQQQQQHPSQGVNQSMPIPSQQLQNQQNIPQAPQNMQPPSQNMQPPPQQPQQQQQQQPSPNLQQQTLPNQPQQPQAQPAAPPPATIQQPIEAPKTAAPPEAELISFD